MDDTLSAYNQYLHEMEQIPPVTEEEERRLLREMERGRFTEQRARNRLVEGYQGLIARLAGRYQRNCQVLDVMDLVQEGNLALLMAVKHYHTSGEASFSTYAYSWARGAMIRAIWSQERAIRLPVRKQQAIQRMTRVSEHLTQQWGRIPTTTELAEALKTTQAQVRDLQHLQAMQVESLDMVCGIDEDMTLADLIADPATVEHDTTLTTLREFLSRMTPRNRVLLMLRYDVETDRVRSQAEVADLLNLSLNTVETLDRRIRRQLHQSMTASPA